MLLRCLILLSLALPFQVFAAAGAEVENDPWLMLEKAGQAAHKLNYRGIFVYQCGGTVTSLKITHMNFAQGEFARLVTLDGVPREVLKQGKDAVIYNPGKEKVLIDRRRTPSSFPAVLPGIADGLKASYQARIDGRERVGDREGVIVWLSPRDGYRYGYRFSIDREFGLLLKSVMLNEQNVAIEQVAFNQLSLMSSEDMDWFRPNIDPAKTYEMSPEEPAAQIVAEGDGWTLAELPAGYRKVNQVRREVPGKVAPINHLVFSDGLASVSLFIETLGKHAIPKIGYMTQGATNIYANVQDGHQVIVVGAVPQATVKKIAEAVSFKK